MPKKAKDGGGKDPIDPFERLSLSRPLPLPSPLDPEAIGGAEFVDTALQLFPHIPKAEVSVTLQFRCTVRLGVGDVVTLRLSGFRGPATLLTLENRRQVVRTTVSGGGLGDDEGDGLPSDAPDGGRGGGSESVYNPPRGGSASGSGQRHLPTAHHFVAFWTGEKEEKAAGRAGNGIKGPHAAPECLMLRCVQTLEANQLVVVGTPLIACIRAPEKLPLNTSKVKIEGMVRHSEGAGGGSAGKIRPQPLLAVDEVRKRAVEFDVGELEDAMGLVDSPLSLTESPGVNRQSPRSAGEVVSNKHVGIVEGTAPQPHATPDECTIAEQLSTEEVDQLWEAAHSRCDVPLSFTWLFAVNAFREYDDVSQMVKAVAENTVACVKSYHHLSPPLIPGSAAEPLGLFALYREIAANLGVKVAQVMLLEETLWMLHGSAYPDLPRAALLVLRLFTMESVDLARVFSMVPPSASALALSTHGKDTSLTELPSLTTPLSGRSAASTHLHTFMLPLKGAGATSTFPHGPRPIHADILSAMRVHNVEMLKKWANVIATLLVATTRAVPPPLPSLVVRHEEELNSRLRPEQADTQHSTGGGGKPAVSEPGATATRSTLEVPVPVLFYGVRGLAETELSFLRSMQVDEWYVFPFFARATPTPPWNIHEDHRSDDRRAASKRSNTSNGRKGFNSSTSSRKGPPSQRASRNNSPRAVPKRGEASGFDTGSGRQQERSVGPSDARDLPSDVDDVDDCDFVSIPDSAVLFELHGVSEGVELSDIGQFPLDREWLLPFCAAFRVVSVTMLGPVRNNVTHVVLRMQGSMGSGVLHDGTPVILKPIPTLINTNGTTTVIKDSKKSDRRGQSPSGRTTRSPRKHNNANGSGGGGESGGDLMALIFPKNDRNIMALIIKKTATFLENALHQACQRTVQYILLLYLRRERRMLLPDTVSHEQYIKCYEWGMRASQARSAIDDGTVTWEVCTMPAQLMPDTGGGMMQSTIASAVSATILPRGVSSAVGKASLRAATASATLNGSAATSATPAAALSSGNALSLAAASKSNVVVRPAVWEPVPKKVAVVLEESFLKRTRKLRKFDANGNPVEPQAGKGSTASSSSGGSGSGGGNGGKKTKGGAADHSNSVPAVLLDVDAFTADFGGKGARPVRRVMGRTVTHQAPLSLPRLPGLTAPTLEKVQALLQDA